MKPLRKLLYTAAHGGFQRERVPLGGGAAVCDMLCAEWSRTRPIDWQLFTPGNVTGREIIDFDTGGYARFCRDFEAASTQRIQQEDPATTAILVNDIAEGPDFAALAKKGYRITTLWHVDVVAYVSCIYCRGLIAPETLTAIHRKLGALYPEILKLIFDKQQASVYHSTAHIVPSPEMKEIIVRSYPVVDAAKIHVLPWGTPPAVHLPADRQSARQALAIPHDATLLLTLSRLSPEKNQQLLLNALRQWESQPGFPDNLHVAICGGAAYMHGKQHEAKLRQIAAQLKRTKVTFPGFTHGESKRNYFAAADLYVFPSRHESYGLTLMEAFHAGLPALTLDHAGARAVMRPEFGAIATEATFLHHLQTLLKDDLPAKGRAARSFAAANPFSNSASRVIELAAQ